MAFLTVTSINPYTSHLGSVWVLLNAEHLSSDNACDWATC
jgi:hypothetical protein